MTRRLCNRSDKEVSRLNLHTTFSSGDSIDRAIMASRRRSIVPLGLAEIDEQALVDNDESFYGVQAAVAHTDSSESDGDARESSDDDSDQEEIADDEGEDVTAAAENPAVIAAGYMAASIRDHKSMGCGCKENHWLGLASDALEQLMLDLRSLSKRDLKIFALGELTATGHRSTKPTASARKWTYKYFVLGCEVCRQVFQDVHGFGHHTLRSLQESVALQQVSPSEHGTKGKTSHKAMPVEEVRMVVSYIRSYAGVHGIPQPAAPRGRAKTPPIYLPASCSKKAIFLSLQEAEGAPRISYEKFRLLWKSHCSDVIVQKPHSDVCAVCDKLRERVRLAKTEEATEDATEKLKNHLRDAAAERQYYKDLIGQAREELQESQEGEPVEYAHLTFDFAQQLELPQHTRQVGPLYFKSRFRVQIFGICEEASRKQFNYIFHEGETIGADSKQSHGPNAVISMVHHHLQEHIAQPVVHMHCDNCVGQNKNRFVLGYLCWRIITGISSQLQLPFMRVGRTRCSIDGYFGLLKMKYRSSEVDSMQDVVDVINSSCSANCAVRYTWSWREWNVFLSLYFKPVRGIAGYQHLFFSADKPGYVLARASCTSQSVELSLSFTRRHNCHHQGRWLAPGSTGAGSYPGEAAVPEEGHSALPAGRIHSTLGWKCTGRAGARVIM